MHMPLIVAVEFAGKELSGELQLLDIKLVVTVQVIQAIHGPTVTLQQETPLLILIARLSLEQRRLWCRLSSIFFLFSLRFISFID